MQGPHAGIKLLFGASVSKLVVCDQKGKRLHEVGSKSLHVFTQFRAKSAAITADMYNGDQECINSARFMFRMAGALGLKKTLHFRRLPYILACLEEPGMAAEALQQFDAVDEAFHHRKSIQFLSSQQDSLRQDVTDIVLDVGLMSTRLRQAVVLIRQIPLDESPAERIHKDSNLSL